MLNIPVLRPVRNQAEHRKAQTLFQKRLLTYMNTDDQIHPNIQNTAQERETPPRRITSRQVVAMAGVILLVLLYIVTLAVSIVDSSASGRLMWMCLFATIAVPILIWIYIWMYGKLTGKKTMSDPDTGAKEKDEMSDIPR